MSGLRISEPTVGPKPPTAMELAVITAVVEEVWPRPTVEDDMTETAVTVWKFANRWWGSNVSNRNRPTRPSAFS